MVESSFPIFFRDKVVHPDHKHILIMAAVKNDDLPLSWGMLVHAPKVIMIELDTGWSLKAGDFNSLRINSFKDMADRPILPSCIHRLEYNQNLVFMLGIEQFLKGFQP